MEPSSNEIESKKILDRVANESETVGTSSMKRVAERVKDHVSANDIEQNEWAEKWGTRIGRALGIVFVAVLILHLIRTYILNG